MVLSDRTIKEELAKGRIVISPLDQADIQPASVDVHLGNQIRVFRNWGYPFVIDLKARLDDQTELIEIAKEDRFSIMPGQFMLGTTKEYVEVPDYLMARLEGKSSLARVGLMIHATAGYVDPGWKGRLTLELSNASTLPILLYPGMKISQISFHMLTTPADRPYGSPGLKSKYQGQIGPTPTRAYQEFAQPELLSTAMAFSINAAKRITPTVNDLRQWLTQSEFKGSIRRFAEALGVPHKTVEDWVYRATKPKPDNLAKLFALTQLPQFKTPNTNECPSLFPKA